MSNNWTTTSWLNYPNPQATVYQENYLLQRTLSSLAQKPALIEIKSILKLKKIISNAERNQCFILQCGDCAESFHNARPAMIRAQLHLMTQMIERIQPALNIPVVLIGRIAGQYAKPRTTLYETQQNITLPSYRGDMINHASFNAAARKPNPRLLLKAYASAKHTLQLLNAIPQKHFFYTSHEALHLAYESALTRQCPQSQRWYNVSTHLPWLGLRTAQIDGAHLEYLRGISNPIGIKVGPNTTISTLLKMIQTLNPSQETGRILLITRLGAEHVKAKLPALIQSIQNSAYPVTWACDPMHGNTITTAKKIKTRHFSNIWQEIKTTLKIHLAYKSHLSGLHLEITPEAVTECLGGKNGPEESDLDKAYKSLLDPRLNQLQSLELAQTFAQFIDDMQD